MIGRCDGAACRDERRQSLAPISASRSFLLQEMILDLGGDPMQPLLCAFGFFPISFDRRLELRNTILGGAKLLR